MKKAGIREKSAVPSMGELISIPFQRTLVCDGAVPRSDTVDMDERPCCLMNTAELYDSRPASEDEMFLFRAVLSILVSNIPVRLSRWFP